MGKILESIGIINGHDIIKVSKRKAKKDKIFEEIKAKDKNIQEEVKELVNNSSGIVYAITKKKIIKGLYIFKIDKKEENLNLVKTLFTKDVEKEVKEKYDDFIIKIARESVSHQEYKKVTLEDKIVEVNPKPSKPKRFLTLFGEFMIGFAFGWIVFDDILFGFIYGIIFMPVFGGLETIITNKKEKKKKKKV